jgi:DNA mismatch endonuclease, patch repair protein
MTTDILEPEERSERMRRVRARGNRSTEWKVRAILVRAGLRGWAMHVRSLPGCPDFVFDRRRVAIFVDGCFWHGCQLCRRPLPKTNGKYWRDKILGNRARARAVTRLLQGEGYRVVRVWEHDARRPGTVRALLVRALQYTQRS